MNPSLQLFGIVCGIVVTSNAANLPSFITPCSRNQPDNQLSECFTKTARQVQKEFAKGIPELGIESIDPLSLNDLSANTGTFTLKNTNVLVKGLKNIEIKEIKWDRKKKTGHTRIFGNTTFLSDYETDGRILLFPINGAGKLSVKMYDTDILMKWKIRFIKDAEGLEYVQSYDMRASPTYGNVKIHMTNLLGGAAIGDTINQVMNENWRDLLAEVGPPYIKAVSSRVHEIINKLYTQVPTNKLLDP